MMHVFQCTYGWRMATQTSQGGAQEKEDFFQALVSSHTGGVMGRMGFELSEGLLLSLKKILFSENTLTRLAVHN